MLVLYVHAPWWANKRFFIGELFLYPSWVNREKRLEGKVSIVKREIVKETKLKPPTIVYFCYVTVGRNSKSASYDCIFDRVSPLHFQCRLCGKIVSNKWHHANSHSPKVVGCPYCPHVYTRKDNLKYHIRSKHSELIDSSNSHKSFPLSLGWANSDNR